MRTFPLLAVVLLAGCAAPPPAGDGPSPPVPPPLLPEDGLPKVEVLLGPGPWRIDEPVDFTLSFHNSSNRTFQVLSPCTTLRFNVTLGPEYDPEPERPAPRGDPDCLKAITRLEVPPGQGFAKNFTWTPSSLRLDPDVVVLKASVWDVGNASWSTRTQRDLPLAPTSLPRIVVAADRLTLRVGEPVDLTATFHNNSTRDFTYTSRDGCNDLDVWIPHGDGYGDHIPLLPTGATTCSTAETPFTIPPGGNVTVTVRWDGTHRGQPVPPARYVVLAEFDGPPGPVEPSWASWGQLELELRP